MAITDANSVLILGAGASVPFGLPLGGKLIDLIRELAENEIREHNRSFDSSDAIFFPQKAKTLDGTKKLTLESLGGSLSIYSAEFEEAALKPLHKLIELLTGQTSETIDDFIAINPEFSNITKLGIATVFFHHLYSEQSNYWKLKPLSLRETPNERRNWVHHLINLVRHYNFNKPEENRSLVRIISFNYDGALETILSEQFDNTEHAFGDWQNYIQVVHPHGFMGVLEKAEKYPIAVIERWANSIDVVKEPNPSQDVIDARQTANDWIHNATEVYMVGFALSGPNARMLRLGDPLNLNQRWFVANYNGSPGLRRVVQSFERDGSAGKFELVEGRRISNSSGRAKVLGRVVSADQSDQEGTHADPLHIDTWFSIGVPGEMPA